MLRLSLIYLKQNISLKWIFISCCLIALLTRLVNFNTDSLIQLYGNAFSDRNLYHAIVFITPSIIVLMINGINLEYNSKSKFDLYTVSKSKHMSWWVLAKIISIAVFSVLYSFIFLFVSYIITKNTHSLFLVLSVMIVRYTFLLLVQLIVHIKVRRIQFTFMIPIIIEMIIWIFTPYNFVLLGLVSTSQFINIDINPIAIQLFYFITLILYLLLSTKKVCLFEGERYD